MTKLTKRAKRVGLPVLQLQEAGLPGLGEVPQGAFPGGLFPLGLFPGVEDDCGLIHLFFSFYSLFYLFPCSPALPIFIIFGGMK